MSIGIKLPLAVVIAALALAVGVDAASALRRLEIFAFTGVNATTRALTLESAGAEVICEVTLNLQVRGTIMKFEGSNAGDAKVFVNELGCRGGRVRFLNTAEGWRIGYKAFTGSLPSIRSIRIEIAGFAFLSSVFGGLGECLFRGNAQFTTGPEARATEVRADATVQLPLFRNLGGLFCPGEGAIRGTLSFERTLTFRLV